MLGVFEKNYTVRCGIKRVREGMNEAGGVPRVLPWFTKPPVGSRIVCINAPSWI